MSRIIHSKNPLPRDWACLPGADRALLRADIWITPRSRIRMKLLIFKTNRDMCRFYREGLGRERLPRGVMGVVSDLSFTCHYTPKVGEAQKPPYIEVDPRYFAVMAMVQKDLCMEVITHEAVHAAYAYARRSKKHWPDHDNPEERICYPAGRIAKRINAAITEAKLYPKFK